MKKSNLLKLICVMGLTTVCAGGLFACSGSSNYADNLESGDIAATVIVDTVGDDESDDSATSDESSDVTSDESSDATSDVNADDEQTSEYYVYENTVTNYIENFIRVQYGVTDEDAWGEWLVANGYTPESLREAVIDTYIERILVDVGSEEMGIEVTDEDIDDYVDTMKSYYGDDDTWESALEQAGYDDESYREEIRLNLEASAIEDSFNTGEDPSEEQMNDYAQMYASYYDGAKRSSHILFEEDNEKEAQEVLDKINAGELDFDEAAKEYSTDTGTAENGGDVGWDVLSSLDDDYLTALATLNKGDISELVQTQYGWHIIKCTDVFEAPDEVTSIDQLPEDWVDPIKQTIQEQDAYNTYESWVSEQRDSADIEITAMPKGLPYDIDLTPYETDEESGDVVASDGDDGAASVDSDTTDAQAAVTADDSSDDDNVDVDTNGDDDTSDDDATNDDDDTNGDDDTTG